LDTCCTKPSKNPSHSTLRFNPGLEFALVIASTLRAGLWYYRWHKLKSIGDPPPGRYHHSCEVVGNRVLLFGGTNAVQFFDSLVGVSVDVGGQLGSLAESLASLTWDSSTVKVPSL